MRVWLLLIVVLWSTAASAHGMRSGYLEIHESEPGRALVRWQLALNAPRVQPKFDADCTTQGDSMNFVLVCPGSLAGRRVEVVGMGPLVTETAAWITLADGTTASRLLTVDSADWRFPPSSTVSAVSTRYVSLGFWHVLSGADHVLFLVLLVLLLRRWKAVLVAETAFTLSHSLSFSATALGWVRISAPAAEACIALSLLLLALDVKPLQSASSVRNGAAMALLFGLVHGLGFAGGVQEAGLPTQHAATALLGFGLGVELAQIAVLVVTFALLWGIRSLKIERPVSYAATYAAGVLSTCWLLERTWSFVLLS